MFETLFKKYFWTLEMSFLATAAVLVASGANQFVSAQLLPVHKTGDDGAKSAVSAVSATGAGKEERSSSIVDRNIFGAKVDRPDGSAVAPGPELVEPDQPLDELSPDPDDAPPVPSSLQADLLATIVASRATLSMAVVEDRRGKDVTVYNVGEMVLGKARLIKVKRGRIIILNEGRREYLDLLPEDDKPRAVASRHSVSSSKKRDDSADDDSVIKTGENEYVVSQSLIDDTLSNLNKVATQARIVPSFRNGQANGFKLFSIRPNSIYSKIGIQNGDIIQKINGFDISSPDRALEIYQKLKDAQQVSVEVERRGRRMSMSYQIR